MKNKNIRIGTAGWSYKDWQGVVYPAKKSKNFSELSYLAKYFDTIEINSTFYSIPKQSSTLRWVQQVEHNKNFQFCIKLWQKFTHSVNTIISAEVRAFTTAIEPVADHDRLGALLIQFPWRFKKSKRNTNYILELIDAFKSFPCIIEFRHASWLDQETYNFCKEHEMGLANIDQPVIGKSIPPTALATTHVGYVRLHGRNYKNWFNDSAGRDARYDYLYNDQEIVEWVQRIRQIAENVQKAFVIFNNHFRGQAVVNSIQLAAKLYDKKLKIPAVLANYYPSLKSVGDIEQVQTTMDLF